MVYEPGKHHGPRNVPNSYVLTPARGTNFSDMLREVEALIKKEHREGDFQFTHKIPTIRTAFLHCDANFAEKVKHLPYVGSVNQEHMAYAQKKRPGGPAL